MPTDENRWLEFTHWEKTISPTFTAYADIECYLQKSQDDDVEKEKFQKHIPCAIGYIIVPNNDLANAPFLFNRDILKYKQFTGPSCIDNFLRSIENNAKAIYEWNNRFTNVCMNFPKNVLGDQMQYKKQVTHCQQCKVLFSSHSEKVFDHCHLSGKFRKIVCKLCNDRLRVNRKILPVFFHNFKQYDCHVLCVDGFGKMKDWQFSVIPQTTEKYIALVATFITGFNKRTNKAVMFQVKFLDSYQFLSNSLECMVSIMDKSKFYYMKKHYKDKCDILLKKGIFPYTWFDSTEKLKECALPTMQEFYDSLTDSVRITENDYQHAQLVWREFGCVTFEDYLNLYLKCDVLQLADVFENFRAMCLAEDQLDPVHYFTIPNMVWDSAFKMTHAKVELLTDVEMYEFFEAGIRGGMTFVNKHHSWSNHKSVPENYDGDDDEMLTMELAYIDVNNLYGHALCQKLPQDSFAWMSQNELASIDWQTVDVNGDIGYTLEVDLVYPPALQDYTIDLPFAPVHMTPDFAWFPKYMQNAWQKLYPEGKKYKGTRKLLMTCMNKSKYVVHFRILQFYLKQGMQLGMVWRGIRYRQAAFFKPYVDYNSAKRQAASDEMLKDYYKLRNNSLYGKTMENIRGRRKFKLVNDAAQHERLCSRDSFVSSVYFTQDLVGVNCASHEVKLNKPVYIGQAVLDDSKLEMYELRYVKLRHYQEEFKCHIQVVGGDTDSFFLHIVSCSLDKIFAAMVRDKLLDTSNYPPSHPLYSKELKARLGCVKDEAGGTKFVEFILLHPKCYSMLPSAGGCSVRKAKGVQSHLVKNVLQHSDYREVYDGSSNGKSFFMTRRIGSEKHQLYTMKKHKLALCAFDDKRAWINRNVSLPYGYHKLALPCVVAAIPPAPQNLNVKMDKVVDYESSDSSSSSNDDDDDDGTICDNTDDEAANNNNNSIFDNDDSC